MISTLHDNDPLRKLFDGLVEQIFMVELGICDPSLTDYLGRMLAEFVHIDHIFRLRTVDNQVIRDVSQMEALAALGPDLDETRRRRLINKYIGDFTLFWTGVYPENLRARRDSDIDRFEAFLRQGKHSYGIASELTTPPEQPPADVLRQLSRQFEYCVHGLRLVRAGWEQLAHENRSN